MEMKQILCVHNIHQWMGAVKLAVSVDKLSRGLLATVIDRNVVHERVKQMNAFASVSISTISSLETLQRWNSHKKVA